MKFQFLTEVVPSHLCQEARCCDACGKKLPNGLITMVIDTMPKRYACQHDCTVKIFSKLLKREMLANDFVPDEPPPLQVFRQGQQIVPFVQPERRSR